PPISICAVCAKAFGAGLIVMGATLFSVTISLASPPRMGPSSVRQAPASTSAIESPFAPPASTAICFAALAKGMPRARPDKVPSAFTVMRSLGPAGTTVISPPGEAILACASSHPASMVSASGTATAKRPAALSTEKPSARLAPEPPQSSGTHASARPDSVSACQSGAFQLPFLSLLMVWASARSAKIFSAVSATMFSLSATAFPVFDLVYLLGILVGTCRSGGSAGPRCALCLAPDDGQKPPPTQAAVSAGQPATPACSDGSRRINSAQRS